LSEIAADFMEVLYYTEIRWLSRGTVLKRVLALMLEIELFVNDKGKVVAELSDEKWHWDLALLSDVSIHSEYLITELQGQPELMCDMFGQGVRTFEMKVCAFFLAVTFLVRMDQF